VPDRATLSAIYARQKLLFQVAMAGAAVLLFAYKSIGMAWTLGLCAALCILMWLCMYPLIRRLPVSSEAHDLGKSVEGHARILRLSLTSLLLVAASVLLLQVSDPEDRWIGVFGIFFFGFAFVMLAWKGVAEARQRRRSAEAETVRRRPVERDSGVISRREPSPGFGRRSKPPVGRTPQD
jgi:hypothetical protein